MTHDFVILGGAGMQGRIVARDLLEKGYSVLLGDLYKESLKKILDEHPKAEFKHIDLEDLPATVSLIEKANPKVVINCAEAEVNLNVYKACLETKHHVIDLGSEIPMTKDQLDMDEDFRKNDLIAITGCGSTPGINNVLLHHAHQLFDTLDTIELGFAWDSNIKRFVVPFSIGSIVYEFTLPAPIVVDGKTVNKVPLENIEEREFREIGKQKCFFVAHPETYTFLKYNKKDGLKNISFYAGFPDHSMDTIMTFINTGLASEEPVKVYDEEIEPLELLNQVLKKLPKPEGYTEKENLWVKIWGEKDGKPKEMLMECIIDTLPGWEDAGCNIDTGIPASIMAQMIADGRITMRGSYPPGPVVPTAEFFGELRKWKMDVYQDGSIIN